MIHRRALIAGLAASAGGLLAGCDRLNESPGFRGLLSKGEDANLALQRLLINRNALAREYRPDQMSPIFRANGTRRPEGEAYAAQAAANFANWRIAVDGLVANPLSLSMDQIRAMPARSQITRRLRRGVERDRQMDGTAAIADPRRRPPPARGQLSRLPLRRHAGRAALL